MAVILFPFTLQGALLSASLAALISVLLGVVFLFVFGAWLGIVTRRRWYVVGARLAVFGLLAAGVNVILP